ncbi:MAG: hypothetical protein ABL928_08360 [Sphingorhabdus sp.]
MSPNGDHNFTLRHEATKGNQKPFALSLSKGYCALEMDRKGISKAPSPAMRGSIYAMRRAAMLARMVAIQTNTGIVVAREGKIVHISAAELLASEDWTDIRHDENI